MCSKSLSDLCLHVLCSHVHCSPRRTLRYPRPRPGRGAAMSVQVTPHPSWVADLDATLEPSRQAILDTPVIIDASENQLVDGQIQNFLVAFYPIIRDFPQWLQMLLDRSPPMGREFFTDNIRVERRHDAMWRAMGDGFNVSKKRFQEPEPMLAEVKKFHAYLTEMCPMRSSARLFRQRTMRSKASP